MGLTPSLCVCVCVCLLKITSRALYPGSCACKASTLTELYLHPLINIFKGVDFILTCILYFKRFFFFIDMDVRAHGYSKAREHPHLLHSPLSFWGKFLLTFFFSNGSQQAQPSSCLSPTLCWAKSCVLDCYIGAGLWPPVVMIVQWMPWTTEPSLQPYLLFSIVVLFLV